MADIVSQRKDSTATFWLNLFFKLMQCQRSIHMAMTCAFLFLLDYFTMLVHGDPQNWPIISQKRVTTYAEVLVGDSTLIQHESLFSYASFCYFRFDDWTRTRRPSRIFCITADRLSQIYDLPIAFFLLSQVIENWSIHCHTFTLNSIL